MGQLYLVLQSWYVCWHVFSHVPATPLTDGNHRLLSGFPHRLLPCRLAIWVGLDVGRIRHVGSRWGRLKPCLFVRAMPRGMRSRASGAGVRLTSYLSVSW